ncbi:dihydrofolate reductase family protein [Streptomyces sp. NPDC058434]|uniref:dihydrofolate reductase family protein n=1 Tax=Streptomyces sp. NPDC058434 TaxID=3346498 RepID=UPI003651A05E
MAGLTLTPYVTPDAVPQAPGGPKEDTRGGFEHGVWSHHCADDDFGAFVTGVFDRVGAFLLGRRTYGIFAGAWPKVTDEDGQVASRLGNLPQYVVSTTLRRADRHNATIVSGNVAEEVARLGRETDGEPQIPGSGARTRSLTAHDRVDQFPLLVPLGARFGDAVRGRRPAHPFRARRPVGHARGCGIHTYRIAGRPEYGAFEPAA